MDVCDLIDQKLSDQESDEFANNEKNVPKSMIDLYFDTATTIDNEIDKYYDNVEKLWKDVILEYKTNPNHGILLDKLTDYDKSKFYELMNNTPVIKALFESKRRLNILINRENKKILDSKREINKRI